LTCFAIVHAMRSFFIVGLPSRHTPSSLPREAPFLSFISVSEIHPGTCELPSPEYSAVVFASDQPRPFPPLVSPEQFLDTAFLCAPLPCFNSFPPGRFPGEVSVRWFASFPLFLSSFPSFSSLLFRLRSQLLIPLIPKILTDTAQHLPFPRAD